jgi:hypothetical protein
MTSLASKKKVSALTGAKSKVQTIVFEIRMIGSCKKYSKA